MNDRPDLTVIILTFNEAIHIERCIRSVEPIARQVYVIDSYSTDETVAIAQSLGAAVLQHPFINQAKQFQWALDHCAIDSKWVIRLDADEYPEPELVNEISDRLPRLSHDVAGIKLRRRHIFMGRWIRHGTRYPLVLLRIWRTGQGRIEQRWMDEHMVVEEGKVITFEHDFSDDNLRDISWWTEKHNQYATREALDVLNGKYGLFASDAAMIEQERFSQAGLKRIVKERIYNLLPAFSGPLLYFLYRYFLRLGFLDGREGAVYHFLQGFWYRFLVEAKVMELERVLTPLTDRESRVVKLEQLTGYSLR